MDSLHMGHLIEFTSTELLLMIFSRQLAHTCKYNEGVSTCQMVVLQ